MDDEWFSEPEPNLIESNAGFSIKLTPNGRLHSLHYIEGDRSVRVQAELLAKPGVVMFKNSIKTWEGEGAGQVSEADRDRIAGNIKRAFEFCGYELQVSVPDYEWLAWYSERKRAAERRHRPGQTE
jgi:hypothetical protein